MLHVMFARNGKPHEHRVPRGRMVTRSGVAAKGDSGDVHVVGRLTSGTCNGTSVVSH